MNKDIFDYQINGLINYLEKNKENLSRDFDFMKYEIQSRIEAIMYQSFEDYRKSLKEIDRLNNIINAILDFNFFKEECPLNFGFSDKREEEAQDVFYEDEWCEKNCDDNYKKCWLKYFDKLKALKEDNKE